MKYFLNMVMIVLIAVSTGIQASDNTGKCRMQFS